MLNILLILSLVGAAPKEFTEVRLVVGYDTSDNCKKMFPVLAKMREAGYNVAYVNLDKPENKAWIDAFELVKNKETPCYLMYVGHEAFERSNGVISYEDLVIWYMRAKKDVSTSKNDIIAPKVAKPTHQREYLKNDPVNTVYLRRRLSEPSCGMLWCMSHRYEILEYVDAYGNVVGNPNR
jgi:hypothetical protein